MPASPRSAHRRPCHSHRAAALVLAVPLLAVAAAAPVAAQMPALPVLQNGFVNPGWSAGANVATSDEALVVAAAGAWTPASARYQVSLGAGLIDPKGEGSSSGSSSGIRVAVPVPTPWTGRPTSSLGLTAFAGAGYARFEGSGELHVPVGVGLGWRRRMGETRALSAFVNPFFRWVRWTGDLPEGAGEGEVRRDASLFRTSVGVEALVTSRLGVTAGYEFGATAEQGVRPGPTGGIFGAGVSYVF